MLQLLFTTATAYNLNVARAPAPTMAAATELPKLYVYGALRMPPRRLSTSPQFFSTTIHSIRGHNQASPPASAAQTTARSACACASRAACWA